MSDISQRKTDHLDLTIHKDVSFHKTTTLFECVTLVHNSLPELSFEDIDLSCEILGKRLRAPILIAAMTGGTRRAGLINRELASIAEEHGYAFGLGSQRPILKNAAVVESFRVRDVAPTALVLGNIGVVQATQMTCQQVQDLVDTVKADALCVHLNPGMELIQLDGDRNFLGNLDKLQELSTNIQVPVVAKETGCGISVSVARRLIERGIQHIDVSGAGGTSWIAVEYHRAPTSRKSMGKAFWDWGIPTAASVVWCASEGVKTIFATGGVASGLDIARAIALGASAGGIARPLLQALDAGGRSGAVELLSRIETELRMAMLLVGAPSLEALKKVPKIVKGPLRDWVDLIAGEPSRIDGPAEVTAI